MIITKIQGGLGNQIFQWAYGKNLSLKYNIPLYLDLSFYNNQVGNTHRNFSLNKFHNIKFEIFNDINNIKNDKPFIQLNDNFNYYEFNYDEKYNYYLNGYWQSEKYFKEFEEIIKQELKPNDTIYEKLYNTPFIDKNVISMHIRRTDYISSNGFHPVQSIDYYKNALNIIGDYDYIYIFSDDIEWCKNNLPFNNIIFIDGFDDIENIWLMSLCKHNIIANSSFSWWGAWLNENPNKKVITPNNWFGSMANLNDKNIIPNNWIRI